MNVAIGTCIRHGHITERCCVLFEPRRARPFLRPAIEEVMPTELQRLAEALNQLAADYGKDPSEPPKP